MHSMKFTQALQKGSVSLDRIYTLHKDPVR